MVPCVAADHNMRFYHQHETQCFSRFLGQTDMLFRTNICLSTYLIGFCQKVTKYFDIHTHNVRHSVMHTSSLEVFRTSKITLRIASDPCDCKHVRICTFNDHS